MHDFFCLNVLGFFVLVLLSAHIKRFSVSRMQIFFTWPLLTAGKEFSVSYLDSLHILQWQSKCSGCRVHSNIPFQFQITLKGCSLFSKTLSFSKHFVYQLIEIVNMNKENYKNIVNPIKTLYCPSIQWFICLCIFCFVFTSGSWNSLEWRLSSKTNSSESYKTKKIYTLKKNFFYIRF